MCSGRGDGQLRPPGFPIRKSPDHSLVADSPGLIAGSNVLHRLLVPRHPPCALINLATTIDARVHCAVLKIRAAPRRNPPHPRRAITVRANKPEGPFPQDPTACPPRSPPPLPFRPPRETYSPALPANQANNQTSTERPPRDTRPGHGSGAGHGWPCGPAAAGCRRAFWRK